jgi:hypothetical protein
VIPNTKCTIGCDVETFNYDWDFAYDNGFTILAKGLDIVIIMVTAINDIMIFRGRRG